MGNTVPRRQSCFVRSSSGTSGSSRVGCNIRSSSGNWHAGAFKNSLKAKSPVKSVQRSFEDSSSPSLKSAGEEVRQVLSGDSEKSRQSLSDSRPPYTPRKNMFGSHSPREGVLQANNPAVPLGSVTPESHKSVEPCTVVPRTPNVGKTQGNTTAVPSESVTPDLHKLVEPRTPIMSMGERIRRFEPRSGGR